MSDIDSWVNVWQHLDISIKFVHFTFMFLKINLRSGYLVKYRVQFKCAVTLNSYCLCCGLSDNIILHHIFFMFVIPSHCSAPHLHICRLYGEYLGTSECRTGAKYFLITKIFAIDSSDLSNNCANISTWCVTNIKQFLSVFQSGLHTSSQLMQP